MNNESFEKRLMSFGLTRQESAIYKCLLSEGKNTGYEVAKQLGISRSNAYSSLASMTEKGAAYLMEEDGTKKYTPVLLEEFCKNRIRALEENRQWLVSHAPNVRSDEEGYITIEGSDRIRDKIRNILAAADERVYLSFTREYILHFVEEIQCLVRRRKKVVIITDQPIHYENVRVYIGEPRGTEIGVIADSKYVLTGEYGEGSLNTCLYSGQKNFVELYKRALSNEIKLLALQEESGLR